MANQVTKSKNKVREPLFHLTKRSDMPAWKAWLIRCGAIVGGFIFIILIASMQFKLSPFVIIGDIFDGVIGTEKRALALLRGTALLLIISLAVTPAFKMKFWNIGAEGQVLISAWACAACMLKLGGKIPDGGLIVVEFIVSIVAGVTWAVIPAIFKAYFNTNETLFTLMMNYIAMLIVNYSVKVWYPNGSGIMSPVDFGQLPKIGGGDYWFSIIFAIVITILIFVYMRFTKHGYEVSVVGDSINTAKYIGINVRKVIIRTLVLSGAVCAMAGFLFAAGIDHMVSDATVGGQGFTAVMVSWLAQFNPIAMVLMSFVVVFTTRGMKRVMQTVHVANNFFADVLIAVVFFIIIAFEFFIRYRIMFVKRPSSKAKVESAVQGGTVSTDTVQNGEADNVIADDRISSESGEVAQTDETVQTDEEAVDETVQAEETESVELSCDETESVSVRESEKEVQ